MTERLNETEDDRAHPVLSYEDDPTVLAEQHHDDYSNHVVPITVRVGKWQLAMTFWALVSAMVWLFYGALTTGLFGTTNAIIAMALSVITFGAINFILAKWGVRTGLNSVLLSRQALGVLGAALTALLLAANGTYFAVFESSTVAVAFHSFFDGAIDIRIWYGIVALAMLPLMLGGVQTFMAKLNGFLLPFYVVGLIVVLVVVTLNYPTDGSWLGHAGAIPMEARPWPGWVMAYVVYMGVWLAMANTPNFARFGKVEDSNFHAQVSFGWVFYTILFVINGLAGAYLVSAVTPGQEAAEAGVVIAIVQATGVFGLFFIAISQIRINTLNYYEASMNTNRFIRTLTGIRVPRLPLVVALTVVVFLVMLTNVFSYIQQALIWQGTFLVGWVGIILTHYFMTGRGRPTEFRAQRLPAVTWGLAVWIIATAVGIGATEIPGVPPKLASIGPILALITAVGLYALTLLVRKDRKKAPSPLETWAPEVKDPWRTYVKCHTCERSYVAVEVDRDSHAGGEPICDACAVGYRARHFD